MSRAGALTWSGEPDAVIRFATDPWITTPDGVPVDLSAAMAVLPPMPILPASKGCECSEGGWAGLFAPTGNATLDGAPGVERCDACTAYPSDLDAAAALAAHIGGTLAVRYLPARSDPRVTTTEDPH